MKKLILFCSLISLSLCAFANDNTDSSKLTAKEVYKDVKNVLSDLGSTLKVGTEHVYIVLIRQSVVESFTILAVLVLSMILLAYCFISVGKCNFNDDASPREVVRIVMCVTSGVLGFFSLLYPLFNLSDMFTGFINPEYGAIERIVKMLK